MGGATDERHWTEQRDESFKEYIASRNRERLQAKTPNQGKYLKALETSTVTLCTGPAGTGKTFMACGVASQMLRERRVDRIVITRPLVSCGQGYGFRPGTVEEKVGPVMRPMIEALEDFLGRREVERLMKERVIEMWPLDDMRGANIPNTFLICDEAQNAEAEQLHMLLTRFAQGSRVALCGDASQTDLRRGGPNPLLEVIGRFAPDCHPSISIVRLGREDIVRHPLLQWIDERLTGGVPEPAPADDGWLEFTCPCGKAQYVERWLADDDPLVQCFYCRETVELFDEAGKLDPVIVDELWECCARDVKG